MRKTNYDKLYDKYQELINSRSWKSSLKIRKFLDRNKSINSNNEINALHFSDPFDILLYQYDKLVKSTFWKLSLPIDILEKIKNKKYEKSVGKDTKLNTVYQNAEYEDWIEKNEKEEDEAKTMLYRPLVSIVVPVYNVEYQLLNECIRSVLNQYYTNWELILVDDKSTNPETLSCLKSYENHEKIKIIYKDSNGGISSATNEAFKHVNGEYVAFLDNDDLLAPNALLENVKCINDDRNILFLYSDEDKIDKDGLIRFMPNFKPDYSPEFFINNNYICHFTMIKREVIKNTGEMISKFDGAQDFDYFARCIENIKPDQIKHISKILYHWRYMPGSTSMGVEQKPHIIERTNEVKNEILKRRKLSGFVEDDGNFFLKSNNEMVSIIIPSKNNFIQLRTCIESIINIVNYKNYEIIIIDNGSDEDNKSVIENYIKDKSIIKYIYKKMDFNFSKICNYASRYAKGEYILFLNDDVENIREDLIERMVGFARLDHVGAVGIKLLYPNSKTIQYAGILSTFPGPIHYLQGFSDNQTHHNCFNKITTNVLSITGACLMINKRKFQENTGFDESFKTNYNDVELCMRLYKKGLYNV